MQTNQKTGKYEQTQLTIKNNNYYHNPTEGIYDLDYATNKHNNVFLSYSLWYVKSYVQYNKITESAKSFP